MAQPDAYGRKLCPFMNSVSWTCNAPARSSSMGQNKNGKCAWRPTRTRSPSRIIQEKLACNGKGTNSMLCSKCHQSADGLIDDDLCPDCHLEAQETRSEIIELAREQRGEEGAVEIDDAAQVSEVDDNGCYVAAWVWVDFDGTKFDKEIDGAASEK